MGSDFGNPGGIIPFFPLDTGAYQNVLIGKIDSINSKILNENRKSGSMFLKKFQLIVILNIVFRLFIC